MVSRVEKKQPRRQKPKSKIAELDETSAERRRSQTCLAQRAFRQRNKDTVASLNAQVTDLYKTIENLKTCFLTFTDDLVASGWLEQDREVMKSLQRTIKHFITVVPVSHIPEEDNPMASDDSKSGSAATESPVSESIQDTVFLPGNEPTITFPGTGMDSSTTMIKDLYAKFSRSHNTAASQHKQMVVQSVQHTAVFEESNGPIRFPNFPYEFVPAHNDAFNHIPQLPRLIGLRNLTFAQKLHIEAIRGGLRLVCGAEDSSQLFYQVFNRVLDFSTRESYRALLNRALDEIFNQPPQSPPETDLAKLHSGGESSARLNVSDVASYFRALGMDFDSSLDIVKVEINPRYLPDAWHDMQDLPTTGLVTPCGDGVVEPQHQQPPQNVGYLSSTAYRHFMGAAQDANEFGSRAIDSTRGYGSSFVSVDVSRLIHEIIQGTRCYYEHPTFNRNDLNVALSRAVVETH